jgi:hypothetical protein
VSTMLINPSTGHFVLGKRKPQLWRFCKIQACIIERFPKDSSKAA